MEGVGLVISLVSVLLGGFVLILCVFFLVRYRFIVYASYIALYAALFSWTASLAFQNLMPVLALDFPDGFAPAAALWGVASKALLIFCIPCLFHFLYEVPRRRLRNAVWGAVSACAVVCAVLRSGPAPVLRDAILAEAAEWISLLGVYLYLLALLIRYGGKMRNEKIRPLHRVSIVLISLYIAVSFAQFLFGKAGVILRPFVPDTLFVPALFILWNVCFLKFIIGFLQVKPIAVPGVDINDFGVFRRNDITEREKEIIRELLTGATVTAIAGKLFISVHTAKTHVKNIYQKLEVRNRVELMNLIQAAQELVATGPAADRKKPAI